MKSPARLLLTLGLAATAWAGFTGSLEIQDRVSSGLDRLSAPQQTALDQLIDADETLAREGGVTRFSAPFSRRHKAKDLAAAGVDRLTAGQRSTLDDLIAYDIAHPELEPPRFHPHPAAALTTPAPKADLPMPSPFPPAALQVHGDVSFTIGGGKGGSFYGGGLDLFLTDPSGRFSAAISISEFRGHGRLGPYWPPGPFAPYPYSPWLYPDPMGYPLPSPMLAPPGP